MQGGLVCTHQGPGLRYESSASARLPTPLRKARESQLCTCCWPGLPAYFEMIIPSIMVYTYAAKQKDSKRRRLHIVQQHWLPGDAWVLHPK